jgi:hypothetical protein
MEEGAGERWQLNGHSLPKNQSGIETLKLTECRRRAGCRCCKVSRDRECTCTRCSVPVVCLEVLQQARLKVAGGGGRGGLEGKVLQPEEKDGIMR